jgi:hypothetical protein
MLGGKSLFMNTGNPGVELVDQLDEDRNDTSERQSDLDGSDKDSEDSVASWPLQRVSLLGTSGYAWPILTRSS